MASLYSVIPGLVPTTQEILEAELMAKHLLEGKFPDLDLREGTGLRDLVLRPTAYAFALLRKANDYYFTQNTIQGISNATPEETVDDILSNWFLERSIGTYAVISARLYFARQKNVTITSDISFSPDNNLKYFPEEAKVYSADALTYDSYSNEWYLDVTMRAISTGSEYNVGAGSLLYFTNFDPYFLRAEINYLTEESTPAESNTQFIERAATAISTRNLVNVPSTESKIRSVFNYISRVMVIGSGDIDMIRDMIRVLIEDPTYYSTSTASIRDDLVTLGISESTFLPGQEIVLSDALPDVFNGRHTIRDTSVGHITLSIPNNPGFISVLPRVSRSFEPLFVHNGGTTDVYCGSRVSSTILQVPTDDAGVATIEGAVYSVSRSEASGGDAEDSVPLYKVAESTAFTSNYPLRHVTIPAPESRFVVGESVEVIGLSQQAIISSISCTGLTVTATSTGHGVAAGSIVVVSGVSPTAYNGTFTAIEVAGDTVKYHVNGHIGASGSGAMVLSNGDLAYNAVVSLVSPDAVQVTLPRMWVSSVQATVTGNVIIRSRVPYTVRNRHATVSGPFPMVIENGLATVTAHNHGYSVGRRITLANGTVSVVNGSWRITAVPTGDTLQFLVPSLLDIQTLTASANFGYVEHRYDYGFSDRQVLEVDFGPTYANGTASFEVGVFKDIGSVQAYLESPANRILCGDYLARGFNLHMLDIAVTGYGGSAPNTSLMQTTLDAYLAAIPAGGTLILSDMVHALGNVGITNIRTPIEVKYTRYTRDLTPEETGTITNYLDPEDKTNVFLLRSVSSNVETV